jgi:hypothetical protein
VVSHLYYLIFWRFASILKWPETTNTHTYLQQTLPVWIPRKFKLYFNTNRPVRPTTHIFDVFFKAMQFNYPPPPIASAISYHCSWDIEILAENPNMNVLIRDSNSYMRVVRLIESKCIKCRLWHAVHSCFKL